MFDAIQCKAVYHDSLRDTLITVAEYLPDDIPAVDTSYVMFKAAPLQCAVIAELFTPVERIGRYTVHRYYGDKVRPLSIDQSRLIRS